MENALIKLNEYGGLGVHAFKLIKRRAVPPTRYPKSVNRQLQRSYRQDIVRTRDSQKKLHRNEWLSCSGKMKPCTFRHGEYSAHFLMSDGDVLYDLKCVRGNWVLGG